MKRGDFSGLVDAQGRLITIFDPATGRDVNGVWTRDPFPGNIIPANRISATASAMMKYYPDPNYTTAGVAPWQNNLDYPEHFNKDLFWNWVLKIDHNFGEKDRAFFRWGENERNEVRNTTAIRSGPAQAGNCPLAGQPGHRRRLGAHLRPGRCSTCVAATRTSWSGATPKKDRVRLDGILALEPRQPDAQQRDRRHLPDRQHG